MKIEEREIMKPVRQTCYVAYDGKQFDNYGACEDYEFRVVESHLARLQTVRSGGGLIPCDGFGYYPSDNEYIWVYVRNHDDVMTILSILEIYPSDDYVNDKDIGKWLCLEINPNDGHQIYINPIQNSMDYVRRLFESLGYRINIGIGANHPCKNEKAKEE